MQRDRDPQDQSRADYQPRLAARHLLDYGGVVDTDTAKTQVGDVVDSAREKTQEQASHVVEKGRGALRTQVDTRSTPVGEQAQSIAESLRQTASQLRQTGDEQKARYAGVADQGAAGS